MMWTTHASCSYRETRFVKTLLEDTKNWKTFSHRYNLIRKALLITSGIESRCA